jgi:hypothetical protein
MQGTESGRDEDCKFDLPWRCPYQAFPENKGKRLQGQIPKAYLHLLIRPLVQID